MFYLKNLKSFFKFYPTCVLKKFVGATYDLHMCQELITFTELFLYFSQIRNFSSLLREFNFGTIAYFLTFLVPKAAEFDCVLIWMVWSEFQNTYVGCSDAKRRRVDFFRKRKVCDVIISNICNILEIGFSYIKDVYISCHFAFVCVLPPVVLQAEITILM